MQIRDHAPASPRRLLIQIDGLSHADFQKSMAEGLMPHLQDRIESGQLHAGSYACTIPSQTVVSQSGVFMGLTLPANQWYDKSDWSYHDPMGLKSPDAVERDLQSKATVALMRDGHTYMSPLAGGAAPKNTYFALSTLAAVKHDKGTAGLLREGMREFSYIMGAWLSHPKEAAHSLRNFGSAVRSEYAMAKDQEPDAGRLHNLKRSARDGFISGIVTDASVRSMVRDMRHGVPSLYIDCEEYDNRNHQFASPEFSRESLKNIDRNVDSLIRAAEKYHYPYVVYADHGCCPGTKFQDLTGQSFDQFITQSLPPRIPRPLDGPDGKPLPPFLQQDFGSGTNLYFTGTQAALDRKTIQAEYPGLIDKVKANPYVAFVVTRDGQDTLIESDTGSIRIHDHQVTTTGPSPLAQFGEGDAMARRLSDMAHRQHQGDLMIFGKALDDGQTVNFGTLPGLHGGLGAHQQAPMIAYPPDLPFDPEKMQDSRDLHQQILDLPARR